MSSEKNDHNGSSDKTDAESFSDHNESSGPTAAPANNRELFNAIETDDYAYFKTCFDELADKMPAHELANSTNYDGVSLLLSATTYDRYEIAGFLMFNGSNPDCKTSKGFTPLYMATYDTPNSVRMVSLLLTNGCDVNAKSNYGHFPLYNAIEQRNIEVSKLLIESGADVNASVTDDGGETALHIAAKYDDDDIAAELIRKGADINAKTDQNYTPVFLAALNNSEKVLKLLIAHDARTDIKADDGNLPIDVAQDASVKEMLLNASLPPADPPDKKDEPLLDLEENSSGLDTDEDDIPGLDSETNTGKKTWVNRPFLLGSMMLCLAIALISSFMLLQGKNQTPQERRSSVEKNGPDTAEPFIVVKAIVYDIQAEPEPEIEAAVPEIEAEVPEIEAASPEIEAASPEIEKHTAEIETVAAGEKKLPSVQKPVAPLDRPYHLIVGSFKETANAGRFMERLKKMDFPDCKLLSKGVMTLVSIESFTTISAAEEQKQEILNTHKLESWVLTQH